MRKIYSPASLAEVSHVDKATIDMLKVHADGDIDIIKEIFEAFFQDADQLVSDISNAVSSGDEDGLRKAAHSLSGVSGSVGALKLKEASMIIENSLKQQDSQTAFLLSKEINGFYESFKIDISNYLK